ncbi:IS701 family transposase [Geobacillus sp. C56-T2]|uniref:IS701 family transposase n=1 Tax=Geobacillus sp. C56-T2 TaxID=600773 RepID=UPI0011A64803|nr:IS701 family transposase [Geobacillus sp. C56-T2]NNV06973.1 IS701 family transposase [Geobacillus sp. MMMUD3]TWG29191.1 DDE family transposase [Geobacillus sp. C56-T2]TWG30850.1 DDE family transposase [Geobacillus sp. C56-T2]TWG30918.1 DDE family transposase [Geobacillus sp. C56-T2]
MNRLAHHQGIHKFFMTLGLALYFSKPVIKHLVHLVDALTTKGFSGTLTDVRYWSFHPNHRTTLSHFFTKSPWNEEKLLEKLQEWILRQIERLAKQENQPLFVSIDDTICQKTKPSSRAARAIQGCDWHYSHKDHQSVWGHSLVWLMVHTFSQAFPFAFRLYDKAAGRSKIDLAIEMLSSLKGKRAQPVYVLMDSWYPSQALIEACLKQGFHVIAMLKTNRILYPKGIAIQAKKFARYIEPNDTRLVTVGKERYRVYRYEGAIHGLDDAVVLLAWKANQPMTPDHLHVVLSTDRELGDEEILRYYAQRWTIECFFRQAKDQLKLDGYRVRHIRAVKRYWAVVLFACVYSIAESQQDLSSGLELLRSRKGHSVVEFIYDAAKQDIPIDVIKKQLHVA